MSAWYQLWHLLHFPASGLDVQADNFQGQIHKLFPPTSQKTQTSTTFSISLSDLDNVDLRVKPTDHLSKHLLIEENVVNVFKLAFENIDILRKYEKNRAAR